MRRISYSALKRFENCPASYLYYIIVPRMEFASDKDMSLFGRKFHEWAEGNFKPDTLDDVVPEDEVDKLDLEDLALAVKDKEYFAFPAVNEIEVSLKIPNAAEVWGYPDRIAVDVANKMIYVIDYKTSAEPDTVGDSKQIKMYAYIIMNNLELRKRIAEKISETYSIPVEELMTVLAEPKPEQFILIVDYVKIDFFHPVYMDTTKFMQFERYLFGVLRRISDLEKEFHKSRNIRKVTHIDGNCNFCMMSGYCVPYQIIYNSYYDTAFQEEITRQWEIIKAIPVNEGVITGDFGRYEAGTLHEVIARDFCDSNGLSMPDLVEGNIILSTMGLVSELQERQRILKLNKLRVEALNRTMITRLEAGDKTVGAYFRKQRNSIVMYPSARVLKAIIPKMLKDSVKDVRFKDMIDMAQVERNVIGAMETLFNASIRRSSVPEKYQKEVEKYKEVKYTSPFLRALK